MNSRRHGRRLNARPRRLRRMKRRHRRHSRRRSKGHVSCNRRVPCTVLRKYHSPGSSKYSNMRQSRARPHHWNEENNCNINAKKGAFAKAALSQLCWDIFAVLYGAVLIMLSAVSISTGVILKIISILRRFGIKPLFGTTMVFMIDAALASPINNIRSVAKNGHVLPLFYLLAIIFVGILMAWTTRVMVSSVGSISPTRHSEDEVGEPNVLDLENGGGMILP